MLVGLEHPFDVLLSHPAFRPLLETTRETRDKVSAEWEANLPRTYDWMCELTGMDLSGEFTVFLTHPALRQGIYLGERRILWAHSYDEPNVNTIYLWHEVLHAFLPGSDRGHAVIELLADHELRVRLNGGSYPPWNGHKRLDRFRDELLPAWSEYLQNPGDLSRLL